MQHRHAGLGIASFILSLGGGALLFLLIVVAGYAEMSTPGGLDESAPSTMLLGLAILGAGVLEVVAVALGIAGLLQRDRRTLFAILGLVCAAGILLGTAGLMVLGAMG
ncbi:hypothetical protein [Stenotrophomonas sp.]|uniref:hypothetical protein n=1 Tax=Stenotrophomonas sp. TaxID=69392 RepID=UPI002899F84E|nr:hypothetical protein [Stenotrophomonas sp.]